MTGTTVKNAGAGAILANLVANTGKSAKSEAVSGGFQTVWSSQMGKNARNTASGVPDAEKPEMSGPVRDSVKQGETLKTEAEPKVRVDDGQPVADGKPQQTKSEELSPEELEEAMEVLGTAVVGMMQEIAEAFGITVEELQGEMEQIGLEPLDLLQAPNLGELILELGGAEDVSALLTDEALCGNYKALMEQLNTVLVEAAETLQVEPKQLKLILDEMSTPAKEQVIPVEAAEAEAVTVEATFERRDYGRTETVGQREGEEPISRDVPSEDGVQAEEAVHRTVEAENRKDGEKQSGKEADGGQHTELFAQGLKDLQQEFGLQQTESVAGSSPWNADTQDIMRQIMDYMRVQLNSDTTNLEMQLHPESLGTLRVQVEAKAGVLTANFITQNEAVKAALESQMVQLRENFEEQGVKVEAIEVTVQSHAFERNLDQGREGNQGSGEPSRKARVRRINLNDLSSVDDMVEEDALAADMLAAGGSTVDYTA